MRRTGFRHRYLVPVALLSLLLVVALTVGCGTTTAANAYAAATIQYNAEAAQYTNDAGAISSACVSGKTTPQICGQFSVLQAQVQTADVAVNNDLTAWKATNAQPTTYTADAQALTSAHSQVTVLRKAAGL